MGYRTLRHCVDDLKKANHLVVVEDEVDANLEAAEIQRRVYLSGGPAVYFANVKNCRFPMVSNLFGTIERARFMFRDTLESVRRLIELKIDPNEFWKKPTRYWKIPSTAYSTLPKLKKGKWRSMERIELGDLPQLKSWPDDGGPYITLPQVYSEHVDQGGPMSGNLGMYRVQLAGESYDPKSEIGLHYQIHRGIGVHHAAALKAGKPFRVNIFVGGTPAMTLSAVMPLPEGLSELIFAGALAGFRIPMIQEEGKLPAYRDADFCIRGVVKPSLLPEGPFGDHLGYYSLAHDFPVLEVEDVLCRQDAIWPFTVVGRPPQEDTVFGDLIHELTGPIIPTVIPGVSAVNAVDAAGVHPLLLAIGSERYTPYNEPGRPQELLTQANAILGQGQMSLAKYLLILDKNVAPDLKIDDIEAFFAYLLERIDFRRDLHFQTMTTIDTLDYSGTGINAGSKVVFAATGEPIRNLPNNLSEGRGEQLLLPNGFSDPTVCLPGVLAVRGSAYVSNGGERDSAVDSFCNHYPSDAPINQFPLIVIVDDSQFASQTLNNFLWMTFTRSNPANDIYGIESTIKEKHWGCRGSLVIDARIKPHHAPPLIEDEAVTAKVDALASRGGALAKYL